MNVGGLGSRWLGSDPAPAFTTKVGIQPWAVGINLNREHGTSSGSWLPVPAGPLASFHLRTSYFASRAVPEG